MVCFDQAIIDWIRWTFRAEPKPIKVSYLIVFNDLYYTPIPLKSLLVSKYLTAKHQVNSARLKFNYVPYLASNPHQSTNAARYLQLKYRFPHPRCFFPENKITNQR